MLDLPTLLYGVGTLLSGGVFGGVVVALINDRSNRATKRMDTQAILKKHDNDLVVEMVKIARADAIAAHAEAAAARAEVSALRPMEAHLYHLQQALEHIVLLLDCDAADRKNIERNARAFVNRIKRNAAAAGTVANEVPRLGSVIELSDGVIRDAETGRTIE